MIGGLPFALENGPVAPGGRIAPEWKVTLAMPEWQPAEQADQPIEALILTHKIQYWQRLAVRTSKTNPRAEGALETPKVSRFHTPFRVNIQPRQSRDARGVLGGCIRKRMLGALARRRQILKAPSNNQPSEQPQKCA
jgi:hypothetical protein